MVDEDTAASIRRAWDEDGDLSGIIEFRRHFPLITDSNRARMCLRAIVGWKPPVAEPEPPAPVTEQDKASIDLIKAAAADLSSRLF